MSALHVLTLREFTSSREGISVLGPILEAEALLTGVAPLAGRAPARD